MRRVNKNKNVLFGKLTKYLPVFIILLSITIIIGSSFAYFTDRKEKESDLTFSKVELSSETNTGINGKISDMIPGSPITNGALSFSKSIDSEAIYVRAKISFSLPNEHKDDIGMIELIDNLRSSTDFNIINTIQNGAIWSSKDGNYFYLLNADDNTKLKVVDTIDTYLLANEIVVPRDLRQLDENAQYMKSINFHIAFEAIQVGNVSSVLSETKELFNLTFPESENERITINVILKNFDLSGNLDILEMEKGLILSEPEIEIPLDENGEPKYVVEGWYTDSEFTNKYTFGGEIEERLTLYPCIYEVSQGLKFTYLSVSDGYSVARGTCDDAFIVVPDTYMGKPILKVANNAFIDHTSLENIYLPDTLIAIESGAFYNCTSLAITAIPSGITSIGSQAFYNCNKLALTSLPDGLTIIDSRVFYCCYKLAISSLPSGITSIGYRAFYDCRNITISSLPDGVETIDDFAFYNCLNITISSLPSGLTNIAHTAFHCCRNITLTSLPVGVETIEEWAFYSCRAILLMYLHSAIQLIGNYAFSDCFNLNYILCQTSEVASLAQGKGREDKYIYALQEIGYDSALSESEVVINDDLTIYTATDSDGYKWVRTSENQYYKCIVI